MQDMPNVQNVQNVLLLPARSSMVKMYGKDASAKAINYVQLVQQGMAAFNEAQRGNYSGCIPFLKVTGPYLSISMYRMIVCILIFLPGSAIICALRPLSRGRPEAGAQRFLGPLGESSPQHVGHASCRLQLLAKEPSYKSMARMKSTLQSSQSGLPA